MRGPRKHHAQSRVTSIAWGFAIAGLSILALGGLSPGTGRGHSEGTGGSTPSGAPPPRAEPSTPRIEPGSSVDAQPEPGISLTPPTPWVVANVSVGLDPVSVAAAPGGFVYAVNYASDNVSVLQNGVPFATVPVGVHPVDVIYDHWDGFVYVVDYGSVGINSTVDVLNGSYLLTSLTVGTGAISAAVDPTDGYLYVVNSASQNVSVIDGTRVLDTLEVGTEPVGSLYDPGNGYVYITNLSDAFVFAGLTLLATVAAGPEPFSSAYDPQDGLVYFADEGSDVVTVLNGTIAEGTIDVGIAPTDVVYDASDGYVDVVNSLSGSVSVLANATPLANLSVGEDPTAALYDPANDFVYVVDGSSNLTTIVSGTSVVAELSTLGGPSDAAYNPSDERVYLTDSVSNQVTLIRSNDTIIFEETGLPDHTGWGVSLGNGSNRTSGSSVTFVEGNGHYLFGFEGVPGYATNASGNVTVTGNADVHRFVPFDPFVYSVQFEEQGLPTGLSWSVQVGALVNASTSSVNEFEEPNGTYRYQVGLLPGYTTNWSGTFTVHGGDVRIEVTFREELLLVTFLESGLPEGTNWSVEVGGQLAWSTGPSIQFTLANGSYPYSVGRIAGYSTSWSGSLVVAGRALTEAIHFSIVTFLVQFHESGLPNGTRWAVSFASISNSSVTDMVGFRSPNGTEGFSIAPVPGFVTNWTGTVRVAGSSRVVAIQFVPHLSIVDFTEVGLSEGTVWTVTLGGVTLTSALPSIEFSTPNGTFPYTVGAVSGYVTPTPSTVRVAGTDEAVSIDFEVSHRAGASGLPAWIPPASFLAGLALVAIGLGALLAWTRRRRRTAPSIDRRGAGEISGDSEGPPESLAR